MNKQILIALTLCMFFAGFASADDETPATIGIGSGSGSVTLPISVTNGVNVGSIHVRLTFDPEIVTVTGVTNGAMDSMMPNLEDVGYGYVQVIAYQASNPGLSGDFDVAQVTFKSVSSSGSCPFGINVITFKDATPSGTAMEYAVSSGTYTATVGGCNDGGRGGGGGGTYPPDPTPTISSTMTSTTPPAIPPTTSHTSSPIKTLPGEDYDDNAPSLPGTIVVIIALLIAVAAIIVLWRSRK